MGRPDIQTMLESLKSSLYCQIPLPIRLDLHPLLLDTVGERDSQWKRGVRSLLWRAEVELGIRPIPCTVVEYYSNDGRITGGRLSAGVNNVEYVLS